MIQAVRSRETRVGLRKKRRRKPRKRPHRREEKRESRKTLSAYTARDARLLLLGFESYRAYLASEMWQRIRREVLLAAETGCCLCGAPATQVHHSNYKLKTLVGKDLQPLHAICSPCHRKIEFRPDKKKRPFSKVNKMLKKLKARRLAEIDAGLGSLGWVMEADR